MAVTHRMPKSSDESIEDVREQIENIAEDRGWSHWCAYDEGAFARIAPITEPLNPYHHLGRSKPFNI